MPLEEGNIIINQDQNSLSFSVEIAPGDFTELKRSILMALMDLGVNTDDSRFAAATAQGGRVRFNWLSPRHDIPDGLDLESLKTHIVCHHTNVTEAGSEIGDDEDLQVQAQALPRAPNPREDGHGHGQ